MIILIAREVKIRQYLPALLYAAFSSFALDVYFALGIRAYVYTSFLSQPLTSIITGIFLSPGFAVLFVHFLPKETNLITYYTLAWVGLLTLTDYTFLRIGELTFYTWHLGYSALAYLISLSIIVLLVRLYSEESIYQHSNY